MADGTRAAREGALRRDVAEAGAVSLRCEHGFLRGLCLVGTCTHVEGGRPLVLAPVVVEPVPEPEPVPELVVVAEAEPEPAPPPKPRRSPHVLACLSAADADVVRSLALERGVREATQVLGVCSPVTLFRACAQLPCNAQTIAVIRSRLSTKPKGRRL